MEHPKQFFIIHDFTWGGDLDQKFAEIRIYENGMVDYQYVASIAGFYAYDTTPTPFLERMINIILEALP